MHTSNFGVFFSFWNLVSFFFFFVFTHFWLIMMRQFIDRYCGMCGGCEPNIQIIL